MRAFLLGATLTVLACGAMAQLVQPLFQNAPASMFTDEDNRIFLDVWKETLDETPVNQSRTWTNPKSGHGGELTTLRAFDWHGSPCKEVRVRNQAQGRKGDERLNACKLDGQWKLLSAEQLTK
jgi:surface antigen